METSRSFELLGTTAYAFITVVNSAKVRQTGLVLSDFTVKFYDPDGSDITSSVTITVDEYEVSGSPTGAYRFSVPIPSGSDEGAYTLVVIDSLSKKYTCIFDAYQVLEGDVGDDTGELEMRIRNTDGSEATGVVIGDLTVRIYDPSMDEISSTLSPGLTELQAGQYLFEFEIPSGGDEGVYFIDVIHPTLFAQGQQGWWRYKSGSYFIPNAPGISGSNDGTGTSVTLTYTTDSALDEIFTYYQTGSGAWNLWDTSRFGSGTVQVTGLANGTYSFYGVASRSGSPTISASQPSTIIKVDVEPDTPAAADDNVRVAVRTMKQKAVYWSPSSLSGFGKPTWNTPVEIDCRWTDEIEEFIDPNGERHLSRAKVIVDRDLEVKGVLWLGKLSNVIDSDDPKNNTNAWEILGTKKTANFKGNKYLRQVYL